LLHGCDNHIFCNEFSVCGLSKIKKILNVVSLHIYIYIYVYVYIYIYMSTTIIPELIYSAELLLLHIYISSASFHWKMSAALVDVTVCMA